MDAMALLCTLHADGPATLRLLRESGCTTLETLRELGDERLAELLDIPPAAARRLLRESDALRARLGDDLLEREEAPLEFAATRRAEAPEAAAGEATRRGGERLGPRDRDLLQRVLSSWRERDASDDVSDAQAPERKPSTVSEHDWLSRAAMRSPVPAPPAAPDDDDGDVDDDGAAPAGLRPGALDGLSEHCCRRLAQAGVHDLEALRRADVLALARASGLGFTLIQRLRFLARRDASAQDALPAPAPSARGTASRDERFSVADGPPRPEHAPLLAERDYELRPRPAPARVTPRNERGPEVPGGPFA